MKVANIEQLNLNDSRVLGISICSGEIRFNVDYVEDYDSGKSRQCFLVFEGCRSVASKVNLDVCWPDSILSATETPDGEWRNVSLEMNTSASVFHICCKAVRLVPVSAA